MMDLGKIKKQNWIILSILGSASFFIMSTAFTLGILAGGFLIIANFGMLSRTLHRAFGSEKSPKAEKISIIAKYYFRLAFMGAVIYILISQSLVDPVGLVIGLSIVVLSIIHTGLRSIRKTSSGEAI